MHAVVLSIVLSVARASFSIKNKTVASVALHGALVIQAEFGAQAGGWFIPLRSWRITGIQIDSKGMVICRT